MLKCKTVTHLLSDAQERELSFAERLRLAMHLAMCTGCSNYRKQIGFLRTACRRYADEVKRDDGS